MDPERVRRHDGVAAIDALTGRRVRLLRHAGPVAAPAAALLGLPLASYTGALIADTAIPVWHESRWLLPAVFAAGAAASAGGAGVALAAPADAAPARRLAVAGTLAELALKEAMHVHLGDLRTAYKTGAPHRFTLAARVTLLVGAAGVAAGSARDRRVVRGVRPVDRTLASPATASP